MKLGLKNVPAHTGLFLLDEQGGVREELFYSPTAPNADQQIAFGILRQLYRSELQRRGVMFVTDAYGLDEYLGLAPQLIATAVFARLKAGDQPSIEEFAVAMGLA